MTHDDVCWVLRYDADEMILTQTMLNRVGAALVLATNPGEGIKYRDGQDGRGRLTRTPATLADRKITLREPTLPEDQDIGIELRKKGIPVVTVFFAA